MENITISGTGCSLGDYLYTDINFSAGSFKKYLSRENGDGGLTPGKLVFTEEFEVFTGQEFQDSRKIITGDKIPDSFNLGGPSIVALINAAQIIGSGNADVRFYGAMGEDETGKMLLDILERTPVNIENYKTLRGASPSTYVFSDPDYDGGHGERIFINNIGTAGDYHLEDLDSSFFDSDILLFGATALVPNIHDVLTDLLKKGKDRNRINVVTTVFDFRNEKNDPSSKWPLGKSDESYRHIDLLVTDMEEALRLSGKNTTGKVSDFFIKNGVSSFIITEGTKPVSLYSDGKLFKKIATSMPVSKYVGEKLRREPELKGDTTGCGDNFAGGVLASLALQLKGKAPGEMDLPVAAALGIVSGGLACFYKGGTYLEKEPGEKLIRLKEIYDQYRKQIGNNFNLTGEIGK